MNGYRSLVIGLCILGAFLVNQASADLSDYLHYDSDKTMIKQHTADRIMAAKTSTNRLLYAGEVGKTRIVKIGSHVLRNQLLEKGCVEAHQVQFLKCPQKILEQTLANYTPVR